MLRSQKDLIARAITDALAGLAPDGVELPADVVTLERPRQAAHGDLACNVAMRLAKPWGAKPRDLAERLVRSLSDEPANAWLAGAEVAGPGFINLHVQPAFKRAVVGEVLRQGADFGRGDSGRGRTVIVEFVSANPTGPLHVGHGRQAALGDSLCALLEACGWHVHREFYYNDAGAQIDNLARSVQARARGLEPDHPAFPADGYRGEYIAEIARRYLAADTVSAADKAPVVGAADVDDLDAIRNFAVACLRHEQDLDLRRFGVRFDHYFLESSLYADGRVERTVDSLSKAGHTYESEGALWLRSTAFGDDKDRVMRKSDGGYTYFVPDVAYHVTKWERGFHRAINIQGSDHHGTTARVRAGLQGMGLGITAGYPDYVLHKMVTVMRGGQEVKISKRAGSYVTLRDLIDWSGGEDPLADPARGRDAVRFFLVSRKADSEFVFDVDLALARTDENPVYYIQYAHARICSVLANDDAVISAESLDLSPLESEREYSLLSRLSEWPEIIETAAEELAPHTVAFYLKDLASDLHSYYNAERVLVDDPVIRRARLALLTAVRQVLRNGLALIGVSAPDRM
ncbi:MAG: arginine--tRNA ligase [Burkholderiaceae bacterium]